MWNILLFSYTFVFLPFSQKIAKFEKSYVCGPGNVHLLGLTVGQLLQRAADKFGDNEAVVVVHQKLRKTYQELLKDVIDHYVKICCPLLRQKPY